LEFTALLLVLLALQINSPSRFELFALAAMSFCGAVLSTPRIAVLRWRWSRRSDLV
jgi:hypothetical protein